MTRSAQLQRIETVVSEDIQVAKKSLCNRTFLWLVVKTLCLILFYYSFSIGLTFFNKRFIGRYKLPLSITMLHLVVKFALASVVRAAMHCATGKPRVTVAWPDYVKKLAPTGIASSLDIGLSNWSFEFITISLYTMSKSTCIIFILGFALLFKLEKFRWSLLIIVVFIATGLFLFTFHSTQFNTEGFLLVISASFIGGLRWILCQFVTQKNQLGLGNPVDMMYHIQPWMIVALLPLSVAFEIYPLAVSKDFFGYRDIHVVAESVSILLGGACLAFMLEFSEFLLLINTSGLTLSISGVFKEVCTLYLAHTVNGNEWFPINSVGLVVCLCGIAVHVVMKAIYRNESQPKSRDESLELLLRDGPTDEEDESENELYVSLPRQPVP